MSQDLADEWFETEVKIDATTLKEFDGYVAQYLSVRAERDAAEEVFETAKAKCKKMEGKLMEYLDLQGKEGHETAAGKITKVSKSTWKAPDGEGRETAIQYLKENGAYDAVTAFNANKFHAWYKSEREQNPEFELPGVTQNSISYINFYKKKG